MKNTQPSRTEWQTKTFDVATLKEYASSQLSVNGWGRERTFIADFFGDQAYIVTDGYPSRYLHNIGQFVMKKFFEEIKGFKKIVECEVDGGVDSAAICEDIEYDNQKTFRGYSDAAVGYEDAKGEKVLVVIEPYDDNILHYRVLTGVHGGGLLKEWEAAALRENFYRGKKITASCKFLDLRSVTWDDVILAPAIKKMLQNMVGGAIANEELYKINHLSLKRGILMSGGPGNGKTSALRIITKEAPSSITVIYAQPCHLGTASQVRAICGMAKDLSPAILIIEDIDWIAEDRDTGDAGRVIELMNQLDGLEEFTNVITLATTNDIDKIEKAIKNRPGRFDRVITIGNPDEDCRNQMLNLFTKYWTLDADVDRKAVVGFSDGLSGAHMADLCRTAAVFALEAGSLDSEKKIIIHKAHFEAAIKEVKSKDYSTYMKMKGEAKPVKKAGFAAELSYDDDDL